MKYIPKPYDTSHIQLESPLIPLLEDLAKNTHENWAAERLQDGWVYGPERNDALKQHPCLIPYAELTEQEKDYDRRTSLETLKTIKLLGYKIIKAD